MVLNCNCCSTKCSLALFIFLALLDYVSRAHGMGSVSFARRPSSVVRPSVASIISETIAWNPFKFWLVLPLGHLPDPFLTFF